MQFLLRYLIIMMTKNRASVVLPLGYADQVMELEMRLEEEESVELIEILRKMYSVCCLLSSDRHRLLPLKRSQKSKLPPKEAEYSSGQSSRSRKLRELQTSQEKIRSHHEGRNRQAQLLRTHIYKLPGESVAEEREENQGLRPG
jgi:ribonucleotide reductase alpha subunit